MKYAPAPKYVNKTFAFGSTIINFKDATQAQLERLHRTGSPTVMIVTNEPKQGVKQTSKEQEVSAPEE